MDPFIVYSLILLLITSCQIDLKLATEENQPNGSMASSQGWRLEDYPNPVLDPVRCGYQEKTSFLCDPDAVLSPGEAKAVLKGMEKLCHNTKSACFPQRSDVCAGYTVIVVLVNRFYNIDRSSLEAKMWANTLRKMQLFNNDCGNDFLFVASNEDKEIAVSLGKQAEEHLTNKPCLGQKLQSLRFKFKDHNIGQVLQTELRYLRKSLTGEMVCTNKKVDRHMGMPRGTIGMLAFAGLFVLSLASLLIYALVKKQKPGTQTLNTRTKCAHL